MSRTVEDQTHTVADRTHTFTHTTHTRMDTASSTETSEDGEGTDTHFVTVARRLDFGVEGAGLRFST